MKGSVARKYNMRATDITGLKKENERRLCAHSCIHLVLCDSCCRKVLSAEPSYQQPDPPAHQAQQTQQRQERGGRWQLALALRVIGLLARIDLWSRCGTCGGGRCGRLRLRGLRRGRSSSLPYRCAALCRLSGCWRVLRLALRSPALSKSAWHGAWSQWWHVLGHGHTGFIAEHLVDILVGECSRVERRLARFVLRRYLAQAHAVCAGLGCASICARHGSAKHGSAKR
jgi:hypothetical protein